MEVSSLAAGAAGSVAGPPERPRFETDWSSLVDHFGRVALAWFRMRGLSAPETEKSVATLFAVLHKEFSDVQADSSLKFRPWLQYAAHIAWCRAVELLVAAIGEHAQSPLAEVLLSVEAHDDFLRTLDVECALLRRRELLARAATLTAPGDWDAFCRVVLERRPVEEVAAERQCRPQSLQAAVHRVHRQLAEDLQLVEEKSQSR